MRYNKQIGSEENEGTKTNNDVNISFNSIAEVVNYIDTVERTPYYKHYHETDSENCSIQGNDKRYNQLFRVLWK